MRGDAITLGLAYDHGKVLPIVHVGSDGYPPSSSRPGSGTSSADPAVAANTPTWRRYSDLVNAAPARALAAARPDSVLKTDLFDEALTDGLLPALAARAGVA